MATQFTLNDFKQNPDGSFSKIKTVNQPRDLRLPLVVNDVAIENKKPIQTNTTLRKLTLTLFGEPMPKQSVRGYATGKRNANGILIVDHFQPKKTTDRTKDYIKQIKEQLPKDFIRFEERVYVTKMHFVFSPLKAFHKIKGRMEAIRAGEIFYKATRPDLPDNLKKLVNDAMSELVYSDDGIIVSEDNIKKYYGIGGCIIIELSGY